MKSILITWNKIHNLGIPIIDEQHRGIVSEINSLFYALAMENNHEILASIIEIIRLETKVHFAIEENLMARAAYPEYAAHREQHRILSEQLNSVAVLDKVIHNPMDFLDYLKNWWLNHINEDDREYAEHVCRFLRDEK